MLLNGKYELELPEYRAEQWNKWTAGWEVARCDAVIEAIIPGNTLILDIGAEQGDFTALWSRAGAAVIAIEANPAFWPGLRHIWELNHPNDILPYATVRALVSDRNAGNPIINGAWPVESNGEVKPDTGFYHLDEHTDVSDQITIDKIIGPDPILPSRLIINMDIEGSELQALKGAEHVLVEYQPIVFVSVHPDFMEDRWNQTEEDLLKFMEDHGYDGELLASDHEEHWVFRA